MAKKAEMIPDDSFVDNGLTRIHPDTRFVIEHKTGLIMFIYKKDDQNAMIQQLLDHKLVESVDQLKYNSYHDILVMI